MKLPSLGFEGYQKRHLSQLYFPVLQRCSQYCTRWLPWALHILPNDRNFFLGTLLRFFFTEIDHLIVANSMTAELPATRHTCGSLLSSAILCKSSKDWYTSFSKSRACFMASKPFPQWFSHGACTSMFKHNMSNIVYQINPAPLQVWMFQCTWRRPSFNYLVVVFIMLKRPGWLQFVGLCGTVFSGCDRSWKSRCEVRCFGALHCPVLVVSVVVVKRMCKHFL